MVDWNEVLLTLKHRARFGFGVGGGLKLEHRGHRKRRNPSGDFAGDVQKISDEPGDGDVISQHRSFSLE